MAGFQQLPKTREIDCGNVNKRREPADGTGARHVTGSNRPINTSAAAAAAAGEVTGEMAREGGERHESFLAAVNNMQCRPFCRVGQRA